MNFITLDFAAFFLLVLLATPLLRGAPNGYKFFLLACNLIFYACAGYAFIPLLLVVALLNWGTVRLVHEHPARKSLWLFFNIAANLSVLGFFKYYEFAITSLETLLAPAGLHLGLPVSDMLFPVGISFYTFQGLSYAIDRYRAPDQSPESFTRVLLFVSFFPTLLAGPIMRAHQFLPQFDNLCRPAPLADPITVQTAQTDQLRQTERADQADQAERAAQIKDTTEGFALILSGLFKKVVLASYLSEHVVRDVFLTPEAFSSWAVLAAVYGYSIQIFCDFSGYSDMAMGVGRLMGYKLPQNFLAPYTALNVQDFWRRWHITLSMWLRDYLYIPLGGSRKGNLSLNLIITMVLGGLWHGAHARFLVWGLGHGLGLVFVHSFHDVQKRLSAWAGLHGFAVRHELARPLLTLWKMTAWCLTFHFVTLLWIFFRAEDMERALEILQRLAMPALSWWDQASQWALPGEGFPLLVIPAVLGGLVLQVGGPSMFKAFTAMQARLPWPVQALVLTFVGGLILKMGPDGVLPFIYFQF